MVDLILGWIEFCVGFSIAVGLFGWVFEVVRSIVDG